MPWARLRGRLLSGGQRLEFGHQIPRRLVPALQKLPVRAEEDERRIPFDLELFVQHRVLPDEFRALGFVSGVVHLQENESLGGKLPEGFLGKDLAVEADAIPAPV